MKEGSNRIYIIGGPGSGKSYAAKKISRHLNTPSLDLDTIFWAKEDTNYTKKASEKERDKLLVKTITKKSWIIEGSYTKWVSPIIQSADTIILLKPPTLIRSLRLIKRSIGRTLTREKKQKENIMAFIKLMRFNHQFNKIHIKRIENDLNTCKATIYTFKKADDAITHILSIR
ncbi:MAG: hypothetical protein ABIJ21_05010 [Nanoarchaeota archaeon]